MIEEMLCKYVRVMTVIIDFPKTHCRISQQIHSIFRAGEATFALIGIRLFSYWKDHFLSPPMLKNSILEAIGSESSCDPLMQQWLHTCLELYPSALMNYLLFKNALGDALGEAIDHTGIPHKVKILPILDTCISTLSGLQFFPCGL